MALPKNKNLRLNSQSLRKNATKEERMLWYNFLKNHRLQWNRQKVIGNYIADFYCSVAKLIVELDGSQHFEESGVEYDLQRSQYFNGLGIQVIRFSNLDVLNNFEGVCLEINKVLDSRVSVGDDGSCVRRESGDYPRSVEIR